MSESPQATQPRPGAKNPTLAVVLSFLLPGVGQLYLNQTRKGILMIVLAIIGAILTAFVIGLLLYIPVLIWSMVDAWRTGNAHAAGGAA